MADLDEIESRLNALERQVAEIRQDAAAARVLAGAADRDVSEFRAELRAHTSTLNALRETQVEQGQEIAELRLEMREGFSKVNLGVAQIVALLQPGSADDQ